ncbi:MAG: GAF domain-containing protein, partial [Methanomicrobia archaeon]|nr:GAF domain-containing protein [Methanomicrobia archaeon]
CVPLKIKNKVIGVLNAESERYNAFNEKDLELLQILASQAAIAIENARLFRELSSLKEFNETIVSSLNEGIWVEDERGNCVYANLRMAEMLGYSQKGLIGKHWSDIVHPSEYEHMKRETETRKGGRVSSYETLLIRKNKEKVPAIVSATPLFEEDKFIGTMGVLVDITKEKETEEKLSAIYDLSREMSLSLDLDKISKILLDAAEKVLNFGNIDLFLVDEEKDELYLKECRGLKEPKMDTIIPIFGEKGITAYVVRTRESLNIPDVRKDERYIFGLKGSRSELCVPIKVGDKVIGVLDAESKELNAFAEEDQRLLETLASQAAIAIENAKLLETIKKSSELQKLFTSILSHDLKNPLTVIKGYAELIKMREDEKIKEYVREMEKSIKKMIDLVTNAEFYSKLQEKAYMKKFEKKYLEDIIKETLKELEEKSKEKNVETIYKAKGRYPVDANPILEDVFLNLIDNAIKYSPENGKIEIDIEDRGDEWRISIKDWGEGVPDELKEAIFERFERGDVDVKGSGLGLAIVKKIVDLHGGKAWVENNPEGGSIFFVEIPKMAK